MYPVLGYIGSDAAVFRSTVKPEEQRAALLVQAEKLKRSRRSRLEAGKHTGKKRARRWRH